MFNPFAFFFFFITVVKTSESETYWDSDRSDEKEDFTYQIHNMTTV
jgi:hypothetical protein